MGTKLTHEQIADATAFHGHSCPGLAIGLRAAELAIREIGRATDEDIVAVVETDMCGVDAIQFLTGCTVGKGNLILLDHGKMVFSFYRRSDGSSLRIRLRPEARKDSTTEAASLKKRQKAGERLTQEETDRIKESRAEHTAQIMALPLCQLFEWSPAPGPIPGRAQRHDSLPCEACGEPTMESRTRRFGGQILCIPCFEKLNRRL